MLNSVVFPAPFGPMIDAIPRATAKSTPCSAVSPPNLFVTPRASNRDGTVAGPRRPPRRARAERAPASPGELALAAPRGKDALRAEDHHQDEDDAEDHPLVLGRLELGRSEERRVGKGGRSRGSRNH